MEEDIRKQGMLFLQQQRFGKKWKRIWCVLYRESSCSISRMEFFECKDGGHLEKNDKTLRKQQENKKVIRLADCIRVTEVDMDGCPRDTGSFLVETTEKIFVFAADRHQLEDWTHKLCEIAFPMSWTDGGAKRGTLQRGNRVDEDEGMEDNSLYSGREIVRDFKVSVRRTDASDRCRLKGDGVLRADMDALHLLGKTGDILYTWPYRYLRRFGRDKSTFSFEAGRRCDSGEGSFEFDTKQGNFLFQAVEAAINLQKISLPHRQTSGGGLVTPEVPPNLQNQNLPPPPVNPTMGHSRTLLPQPRVQVQQPPGAQAADGVYSMVTEPQNLQMVHDKEAESSHSSQQQRPQQSRLEPPVDKILTGVKSLTLDTRGVPIPRKNQVKMISSCPLPNASPESGSSLAAGPGSNPNQNPRLSPKLSSNPNLEQTYSQITMTDVGGRGTKKEKSTSAGSPPMLNRDPEYSLPFDTIASNVMSDILQSNQDNPGADPLYDSIDEMKIRNIFRSEARTQESTYGKVDHIYDEPEGCAAAGGQKVTPHSSVYDDPEEMRGDAWRIMGTSADPKGHEYPYNPRVDDYAVPKRPKRVLASQQSLAKEEEQAQNQEEEDEDEEDEEEREKEEQQFSPYNNVIVKIA
ncbi:PREDICTED: docking protein 2-like [Cyprinodon variegatus]|uniref:Docking protein 2-like n=1 Tax=Cyprinodon variegatus TaxID=28743 RepID=A0A3Q2FKT9_CYPVA|nr:PREDICTED: docking protein 2-like [Cyprinodon variegatus]